MWLLPHPLRPRGCTSAITGYACRSTTVISVGADGVPYQRPEITLLFKARLKRNKDEEDLRATLPVLTDAARTWLRHALTLTEPGHPWIARLED